MDPSQAGSINEGEILEPIQPLDFSQEADEARMQHNALVPISTLPDELLTRIFLHFAYEMTVFARRCDDLIILCRVCRHWAKVALNYPKLWSYVDLRGNWTKRTEMQLRRSQEHPLVCMFDDSRTDGDDPFDVLTAHGHHIVSLDIEADGAAVDDAFRRAEKLPILEKLVLEVTYGGSHLPEVILGAPRLRSICLYGSIRIDGWNHVSNLTELVVKSYSIEEDFGFPTFDELFALLRRCPQLHRLMLSWWYLPDGALSNPPCIHAQLPLLEDLELYGITAGLQYILQSLSIPPTAMLNIDAHDAVSGQEVPGLLNIVRRHLNCIGAPPLRSFGLSGGPNLVVVNADTAVRCNPIPLDVATQLCITFHPRADRDTRKLISMIMNVVPLSAAAHFETMRTEWLSRKTWRAVFLRLPRVAVVETAVGAGMLSVAGGLFDAVQRGARGRAQKKRFRAQKNFIPPTRLNLGRAFADGQLFGELDTMLAAYKAMDAPAKPAGVPLAILDVTGVRAGGEVYELAERLSSHVGQLIVNGETWGPASGVSAWT
ncbi:hypothetical protein FA95DRAFT_346878 [Auriscalpium vulgare]|uniref:Uncharacterized protein n=1 Tax=Auriscalpium vulgare TaxID=40419 RepID=A0ACB8RIK3_9AGAM|nr:hypothetical protein FA95DRAFT_346878 [Auriscalpium vulgare]